jgi:hypothetical protein
MPSCNVQGTIERGFISDGAQGKVIIFDLKTLKVTGEVKADKGADCVIYDHFSKRVFIMNGESRNSTVIDAKSGDLAGNIGLFLLGSHNPAMPLARCWLLESQFFFFAHSSVNTHFDLSEKTT